MNQPLQVLGLVSLFKGISNSMGYLMPKPFLKKKKNSSCTIKLIAECHGWNLISTLKKKKKKKKKIKLW